MPGKNVKLGLIAGLVSIAIALIAPNSLVSSTQAALNGEQNTQAADTSSEATMEQKYKNIQVLKGVPASQMRPIMNYISATLGMNCAGCHVRTGDKFDFEKDDNGHKKVARQMIQMTMDINKNSFGGRPQVSCMTCHRGSERPVSVPELPRVAPKEETRPSGPAPTAQDIYAKYVQAVGGREAIEKIKTRVIKGSSVAANGQSFPLEIQFAAPDKYSMSVELPQGASAQKMNGTSGWLKNAREDRAMESVDLMRARSLALSLEPLQIKSANDARFGGYEKIGDRETVVLRATLPDKRRARYFFDKDSGLLVRRIVTTETVIGLDPEQTDYEDYRDVDGVKVPFTIRTSYLDQNYSSTRKFTEVKNNAKIDDEQFKMPAAKQ